MRIDMLNYPISGSHWLAYCIYKLINAQFIGICPSGTYEGAGTLGYIGKTHGQAPGWWESFNIETDALIVLVRNYKECMVRQRKLTFEAMREDCLGVQGTNVDYIAILQRYDEMPEDRRILIYYEDLMDNCDQELGCVMRFLGQWYGYFLSSISTFCLNLEEHKENSRQIYNAGVEHTPCQTKGEPIFHSKKLSQDDRLKIDSYLRVNFPEIFNKYLERYSETKIQNHV